MNARLAGIAAGMQTLAASIDGLKAAVFGSIESLKAEIRIVKAEVGTVNSDVVSLKAVVGEVKQEATRARDATDSLKYFVIGTGIALAALLARLRRPELQYRTVAHPGVRLR